MIKFDVFKGLNMEKLNAIPTQEVRFKEESDLQKDPITDKTQFLYFIKRDVSGYKTGWVWSENKADLVDLLLDVLVAKQFIKEHETPEMNSDGYLANGLQEAFILSMASSLVNQNLDPAYYAEFSGAVNELSEALNDGSDLNIASVNLMDFTSNLFYSLTWSFFQNEEEAKEALRTHSSYVEGDFMTALLNDNSL